MSKESVQLLKNLGYRLIHKMGKQKFIPAFSSKSAISKAKKKRNICIMEIIQECYEDAEITRRIRRSEDLVALALKVSSILNHAEYRTIEDKDELRRLVAQLLSDSEHRSAVENILNKNRQPPKRRPLCRRAKTKKPMDVIQNVLSSCEKAWNFDKNRYRYNESARLFQTSMKRLISRDWLHQYCILSGYEPVLKGNCLGEAGRIPATSCGCRHFDQFARKKSFLEKLRRERRSYRYHTMKKSLRRIRTRTCQTLFKSAVEPSSLISKKRLRSGVWTRVFMGTKAEVLNNSKLDMRNQQVNESTEMEFMMEEMKDISRPRLSNVTSDVAVKVFAVSTNLPLKLIPARVFNYLELTSVLDHPNIVPFLEIFASLRDIFVIMPYAENRTLQHLIKSSSHIMLRTAQVWTFHIALAMQYLHSAGVIHRNIKCSNILITRNYDVLLSGFGSAKIKRFDQLYLQEIESRNYSSCYLPYRPPEVLLRKPYILPLVDIWCLGVVLFKILNKEFPFCHHDKKLMVRQQRGRKWKKRWTRESDETTKLCLNLLKKLLEPSPSVRIRIDLVVRHKWFKLLTVPDDHVKALRSAPLIFSSTVTSPRHEVVKPEESLIPKSERNILDEVTEITRTCFLPQKSPCFKPLEEYSAYKNCYMKSNYHHTLLNKIDESLRKITTGDKKHFPLLEYESYISEQEEKETYQKMVDDLNEVKKHPEDVRKMVYSKPPKMNKLPLTTVVERIKERLENVKSGREGLTNNLHIHVPKLQLEPRSILQARPLTRQDKKFIERATESGSKMSVSTREHSFMHGLLPTALASVTSLVAIRQKDRVVYPKLEFVAATANEGRQSSSGDMTKSQERLAKMWKKT